MYGAIVGNCHVSIWADRQLRAFLGVTINVDNELVARSKHIVLWRGDIHHWLEGE